MTKRKNIFTSEDALHAAFVEHCNKCDCPMGCIHRNYMLPSAMLDTRCASILKCFARFVVREVSDRRPNTGNLHCVIREFPKGKHQPATMFFEAWGNKRQCLNYAKKAAKPNLRLCKVIPIIKWDKSGRVKEARCDA